MSSIVSTKEATNLRSRAEYVNIIIQNRKGSTLGQITGRVLSGNISVNSNSSVRRTGTLSVVTGADIADIEKIHQEYNEILSILSIGARVIINTGFIDSTNPDILYEDCLGNFIISKYTVQEAITGITINLNLTDKMALLNGEFGGIMQARNVLSEYYIEKSIGENKTLEIKATDIPVLIQNLVTQYGELVDGIDIEVNNFIDPPIGATDGSNYIDNFVSWGSSSTDLYILDGNIATEEPQTDQSKVKKQYKYKDTIGYIHAPWFYPGKLEVAPGDTITSALDKIVSANGNAFTYYFDKDGFFQFRRKKGIDYAEGSENHSNLADAISYTFAKSPNIITDFSFRDNALVISKQSNDSPSSVKNDITLWGGDSATTDDVRYHLILDSQPSNIEVDMDGFSFYIDSNGVKRAEYKEPEKPESKEKNIYDYRNRLYFAAVKKTQRTPFDNEILEWWPTIYDVELGRFLNGGDVTNVKYYLDFISIPETQKISVSNIGRKPYVKSDKEVKCLFAPAVDKYLFLTGTKPNNPDNSDKTKIYIEEESTFDKLIYGGAASASALNTIKSQLHDFLRIDRTISLTTIPLYFLDAESIIEVDEVQYIVDSLSIPLGISGNMTINAHPVDVLIS